MRVLWTCNLIPTEMLSALGKGREVMGGWIESMLAALKKSDRDIEIAVACKCDAGEVFCEEVNGTRYYSLAKTGTSCSEHYARCLEIIDSFSPELIQIEGTEFIHAKAMLSAAESRGIPAIVSLQGILNGQYAYQCGQLQTEELMLSASPSSFLAGWGMFLRKTRWFRPRLAAEREVIGRARYILGRTTWDSAHAYALNPEAKYYSCPRVLREPFYGSEWRLDKIERHSIYTGSGYTALKGLHWLVQALPQLKREYPDIKVYVAGYDPYPEKNRRSPLKQGYALYLRKLMNDLGVRENIVFTGTIPAEEVARRLERAHAYVLTSAIENSPNTLGEAMTVGTPCVTAYVGGVPDMASDGKEALFFRNDDPALLAYAVKRIFDDDALAEELSANARARARLTHSPENNARLLLAVYDDVLSER